MTIFNYLGRQIHNMLGDLPLPTFQRSDLSWNDSGCVELEVRKILSCSDSGFGTKKNKAKIVAQVRTFSDNSSTTSLLAAGPFHFWLRLGSRPQRESEFQLPLPWLSSLTFILPSISLTYSWYM